MKGTWITAIMMGGALAAGSAAAYLANRHIESAVLERRSALEAQYEPVRVIVAGSDLRIGAQLSSQTVAVRELPRAFLHSEAVLAERWSEIAGRVLAHTVRSGEPVLRSHLAQDAAAGFSGRIGTGMRALTFPVDEESSIAGMLSPGDRVDILFTTTSGTEPITLPLLVDVPVIATGMRTISNAAFIAERHSSPYRTVTVSVTPEDAARITLAQDAGKITITLRQPDDGDGIQIARITKTSLLSGSTVRRRVAQPKIEIIIGNM